MFKFIFCGVLKRIFVRPVANAGKNDKFIHSEIQQTKPGMSGTYDKRSVGLTLIGSSPMRKNERNFGYFFG